MPGRWKAVGAGSARPLEVLRGPGSLQGASQASQLAGEPPSCTYITRCGKGSWMGGPKTCRHKRFGPGPHPQRPSRITGLPWAARWSAWQPVYAACTTMQASRHRGWCWAAPAATGGRARATCRPGAPLTCREVLWTDVWDPRRASPKMCNVQVTQGVASSHRLLVGGSGRYGEGENPGRSSPRGAQHAPAPNPSWSAVTTHPCSSAVKVHHPCVERASFVPRRTRPVLTLLQALADRISTTSVRDGSNPQPASGLSCMA